MSLTTEPTCSTESQEVIPFAELETDPSSRISWTRVVAYGLLPGLALVLALVAGYLNGRENPAQAADLARVESTKAATQSAIQMLSYKPDTVEHDLGPVRDHLTGVLKDSYAALIRDVVIPGAKQKKISVIATVPAAASVSATANHAVVLLLVDQSITMGNDPPTSSTSSVRVTLEKVNGQWLISQFDPT